jgi:hypothetical protein
MHMLHTHMWDIHMEHTFMVHTYGIFQVFEFQIAMSILYTCCPLDILLLYCIAYVLESLC